MKNKFLLVSFCNIPTPTSSPLLLISLPLNKESKIIPVSLGNLSPVSTATGLAKNKDTVFISFISKGKFWVSALFLNSLETKFLFEFPVSQDVHSMIADDKYLYTISTGTDELIRYEIHTKGLKSPVTIWKASDDKKENHHINSVANHNGDIVLSAFGKSKMENAWRTAHDGIIFNVNKGIILKDGLYHPHSVTSYNGDLFYCESGYGKFSSLNSHIKSLNGYTRGLQFSDGVFYVGTSVSRSKNKNDNIFYNPADQGKRKGHCKIYGINPNKKKIISEIDLEWFAPEIYDLLTLELSVNVNKLFMKSFLDERIKLSNVLLEKHRFWKMVKDNIK